MSDAFDKIIDVKYEFEQDGFRVPAMRVDPDTYKELLKDASFIAVESVDVSEWVEHEDAEGIVAGMDIIPDDTISAPVPDDVIMR